MWAKFDDNYDSNPKVFLAGLCGKSLHESSIRWCCRQRTSGRIPKDALELVATLAQLPTNKALRFRTAARLVELNLWEDAGEAWLVHDFDHYGPPQRFLGHDDRGRNHDSRGVRHAQRDPVPSRPVPSLEDLTVFNEWAATMPNPGRMVFTPSRQRAVQKQRKAGYSQEDLLDCVRGWVNDPWEQRPQQNDLEQLLRKVEKFRDLWRNGKPAMTSSSRTGKAIQAARDWQAIADEAEARGV